MMIRLHSTLTDLVELLSNQQFHHAIDLAQTLNISPTAVLKMIKTLTEYDIPIHHVHGKGYVLKQPLILLNFKKINQLLKDININHIAIFETIASTQTYLSNQPTDESSLNICLAETQTQGRGRLNRSWYSPFGQNIYMSISCILKKNLSQLNGLPLVVALSLADAIDKFCHFDMPIFTKWPNDLICNQKKLAGILVNVIPNRTFFSNIIIGIGLNVNLKKENGRNQINQSWTSLSQINPQYYDRNLLISAIIHQLTLDMKIFQQKGWLPFISQWRKRDYLYGKSITATTHSGSIIGKAMGVSSAGHLKIKTNTNQWLNFSVGDIELNKKN